MQERQNKGSLFATLPGLLLLVGLILAANFFGRGALAAFLFVLLGFSLLATLWARLVVRGVKLTARPIAGSGHAGEVLTAELCLQSGSVLPLLWLDVLLPLGKRELLRPAETPETPAMLRLPGDNFEQNVLAERFVWMHYGQQLTCTERWQAMRRGAPQLCRVRLLAGDGLGLSVQEREFELAVPAQFFIYPARIPVQIQPFLRSNPDTVSANPGEQEDATRLKGVRPYQNGDPAKRVNWRLLASTGRMQTNLFETLKPGCKTFVLDLQSFRRLEKRTDSGGNTLWDVYLRTVELEQLLCVVASCMEELQEHQIDCALVLPGFGDAAPVLCLPQREGITPALEALALLDYHGEAQEFDTETLLSLRHRLGEVYFCTAALPRCKVRELAETLGQPHFLAMESCEGTPGDAAVLTAQQLASLAPDTETELWEVTL